MNIARTNSEYQIKRDKIKELKVSDNEAIHLVSAGPSCRGFDWQTIKGEDVMSINNSLYYLPIHVSYHVYNEPIECEVDNYNKMSEYTNVQKFTTFKKSGWTMLSLYPNNNLAFQIAILLSLDLGYSKLKLYGFNFSCRDKYIHWWDDKPSTGDITDKSKMLNKQSILFKKTINNIKDKIEYITI